MWPRLWQTARSEFPRGPRVLLYSHDTFGLGHLRRSRAIAIALVEAYPDASVLIVTGSPIVGRFDFPRGVDFVRVPGVVKLPSGDYATHNMSLDIADTTELRRSIILDTARSFAPDLLIVDKEPTGFRGELLPTLELMRSRGSKIVLGLRDVLDEPDALSTEWDRKNAMPAVERFYDEIWVYGLKDIYDATQGLKLSKSVRNRIRYTGYLKRETADWPEPVPNGDERSDYVLITAGGGGDGDWLMDWAISAYENDPTLTTPALMVFGPFLNAERRRDFEMRAAQFDAIRTLSFDSRLERLMLDAVGVVAMGGYNTFCEVLSFDKPAVIAPRTSPRLEQYIRAHAASTLGLVRMLPTLGAAGENRDPKVMADAIRNLPTQRRPSAAHIPGLLGGLDAVVSLTSQWLGRLQAAE
ncbi:MAG: hypothetical protein AAFQ73_00720 [Pseudomonadota bacterium]